MRRFVLLQLTRVVCVAALLVLAAPALAERWTTEQIAGEYAIDVPRNWDVKSEAYRKQLFGGLHQKRKTRLLKLTELVFMAELKNAQGVQIGLVLVEAESPHNPRSYDRMAKASMKTLERFSSALLESNRPRYQKQGFEFVEPFTPEKFKAGKHDAVMFARRWKKLSGHSVFVRNIYVLNGEKSLQVLIMHDERYPKLKAVTDRIVASVRDRAE